MKITLAKTTKRTRRHARIRAKVSGTAEKPRLAVFRSNRFVYAQLIDDVRGVTLAQASTIKSTNASLRERARSVGQEIARKAKAAGIASAVFDRGGFLYAGSIKEVAEGAREEGLMI